MVAFKIDVFGGMKPGVADELLPDNAAALAQDTWLYRGNLVGLPTPVMLYKLKNADTTKVYRIPTAQDRYTYLYDSVWMEFPNIDTDVVKAPVFGDVHQRYYWASSTTPNPMYNTFDRIKNGDFPWMLGINPPATAPTVAVSGGSERLDDVDVATTSSGVLATDYITGKVIDGYTLKANDRILIKNLTGAAAKDNGIRVVGAGSPARATDMDVKPEFIDKFVKVLNGTANAGTYWECTNDNTLDVGTTPITFKETAALPVQVTRAYVYTWVTEYGEESAPSKPAVVTGAQGSTWNITNIAVPDPLDRGVGTPANRFIKKTRIYRTVTSSNGVATFFLVKEQDCTLTSFTDNITDDVVTQNSLLESFLWTPPPPDLKGLTVMWNGMIAGFRENELWFCEPYRPHAWPASFVQTLEYPIVGLGVANQTLVACTAGNPVTINGSIPDNLTTAKIAKFEPCTSRGSILSSPNGVVFTSPNGLVVCGQGGAENLTVDLITRDRWWEFVEEARLRAAWFGGAYYAFGEAIPGVFDLFWISDSTTLSGPGNPNEGNPDRTETGEDDWVGDKDYSGAHSGIFLDPSNPHVAFSKLTSDLPVINIQNDPWSGEVFIIRHTDAEQKNLWVQWLDITKQTYTVEPTLWRSKILQTLDKRNLGAMRVYFRETPDLPKLTTRVTDMNVLTELADNQWGICRIYADGELRFARELRTSGELWKLPSGFLAEFWQYEIETRLKILSVQMASSTKELSSV